MPKSRVSLNLKNNYKSDELFNMVNDFDFLSFDEIQFISAKFKLFIGFVDKNAEHDANLFITNILNGTHPIVRLKR